MARKHVSVWSPQAGPQEAFCASNATDVFYGGSRGGGKTDALLGDWIGHAAKWGKAAHGLLFRRTIPELDEVILRSKQIYGSLGAVFQESKHDWTFPNGAILRLRYLDEDSDAERYKGFNVTWMAFDELTHWPSPVPVDKLFASLRSARGVKCVRRMTGNPGGPGHQWVKERYIKGKDPYSTFWYTPQPDRPDLRVDAVFIPATIDDNKLLVENDPTYEAKIAAATAGNTALWKGWRYGDWDIISGAFFDCWNPARHVVEPYAIEPHFTRWMAIDWGYAHDSAVLWGAFDGTKILVYREFVAAENDPKTLAEAIVTLNQSDPVTEIFLSTDAFARRQSERTIADEIAEVFDEAGLPVPSRAPMGPGDRVSGWALINQFLVHGNLQIVSSCRKLIETIPTLQRDEKRPEDVLKVVGDDTADCLRYLVATYPQTGRKPLEQLLMERVTATDPTSAMIRRREVLRDLEAEEKAFVTFRRAVA